MLFVIGMVVWLGAGQIDTFKLSALKFPNLNMMATLGCPNSDSMVVTVKYNWRSFWDSANNKIKDGVWLSAQVVTQQASSADVKQSILKEQEIASLFF